MSLKAGIVVLCAGHVTLWDVVTINVITQENNS